MAKQRKRKPREPELVRRDGALCAAFVNTASDKRKPLETYADLVAWGLRAEAFGAADAERLERVADKRSADAEAVVRWAQELRDGLERILLALVDGQTLPADDLDTLNAGIKAVMSDRCLVPGAGGYQWGWDDDDGDLGRMLRPVLLSAAEVLTSKYRRRVRQCAGEGCDLLFVDRTPGSPRKWCSMQSCGHRVNSLKHYRTQVKPRRERGKAAAKKKETAWAARLIEKP